MHGLVQPSWWSTARRAIDYWLLATLRHPSIADRRRAKSTDLLGATACLLSWWPPPPSPGQCLLQRLAGGSPESVRRRAWRCTRCTASDWVLDHRSQSGHRVLTIADIPP